MGGIWPLIISLSLLKDHCVEELSIGYIFFKVESSSGAVNDVANTVMQKFWDSAFNLDPPDDYDTRRYHLASLIMLPIIWRQPGQLSY